MLAIAATAFSTTSRLSVVSAFAAEMMSLVFVEESAVRLTASERSASAEVDSSRLEACCSVRCARSPDAEAISCAAVAIASALARTPRMATSIWPMASLNSCRSFS